MVEPKKILRNLDVREISIVPYGANNKTFLLVKGAENLSKEELENVFWLKKEQNKNMESVVMVKTQEELQKEFETEKLRLEKELKDAKDASEKFAKEAKEQAEKLEKEASEKAAKLEKELKDATERAAKLAKESEENGKIAKEERNIRITKEKIDFAKEHFDILGDSKELGVFLKEAEEKLSKESYELMVKTFTGANEKIKKSDLFKEIGTDASSTANNVISRVDKMAKEIMEKEKIDYSDALAKVFVDEALYEEYEKATSRRGV